jgi:aminoglycoside phosphotransferase (APT) family kinase protein
MYELAPYLKILNTQLMTTLRPKDEGMARKVAIYGDQMLSVLVVNLELTPKFKQEAFLKYQALLPDIFSVLDAAEQAALRGAGDYEQMAAALGKVLPIIAAAAAPVARSLMQSIARIEMELKNAELTAINAANTPAVQPGGSDEVFSSGQQARLQDCFRAAFPAETKLEIGKIKALPGGLSKQTIFVELHRTEILPSQVVLRVDTANSPHQTTVVNEFALIKAMFEAGIPVPEPFALIEDASVIGAPFLVLSRVEGHTLGDALDVFQPSREFGLSLAKNLAKMHNVAVEKVAQPLPGADVRVSERMLHDIADFEGKWRTYGQASIAMELALRWMKQNIAYSEGKRCIIHRDVGCHNMLVRDHELAALLDWETACAGNPAQDLGYAYHTVVAMLPWEEFLAAYEQAGGAVPRPAEIDFYRLWRAVWLTTLNSMARAFTESGQSVDPGLAYAGTYGLERCEQALHEMADLVLRRY